MNISDVLEHDERFRYQMLDRMRSDCDYYLGYGNRHPKFLWAGNEKEHIDTMKSLWLSFGEEDKPVWLTWEQIEKYEEEML